MSYSAILTKKQAQAISDSIYKDNPDAIYATGGGRISITCTRVTFMYNEFKTLQQLEEECIKKGLGWGEAQNIFAHQKKSEIYSSYTNDAVIDEIDEEYQNLFTKD